MRSLHKILFSISILLSVILQAQVAELVSPDGQLKLSIFSENGKAFIEKSLKIDIQTA